MKRKSHDEKQRPFERPLSVSLVPEHAMRPQKIKYIPKKDKEETKRSQ